jgi:lipid II isoglutaminyl synthase (glutamine-hydrolysing)
VSARSPRSTLAIAVVFPDLLGTYGDGGNGMVLARRAAWRGIDVDLLQAESGRPLPSADLYCIGGGEDGPQVRAAAALIADGTLVRACERGAAVLGVCAGYQLLGRSFPDAVDRSQEGLGLLDVATRKGSGPRAVGEVVVESGPDAPRLPSGQTLPPLTGFENHGGVTVLGPATRPVGQVVAGVGNGDGRGTEGAWGERVVGSYLHGPLLARNPALADLLLGWAVAPGGDARTLDPLDDAAETALRTERLTSVTRSRRTGLVHRLVGRRG